MVVKTIVVRNLAARAYVGSNPTLPTKARKSNLFEFDSGKFDFFEIVLS